MLQGARVVLDFGFGESAVTSAEWREVLPPEVHLIGVERTLPTGAPPPGVEWVQGSFDVVASLGPASVIRALNVLRGYREDEVAPALAALKAGLAPDGLLIEGSADTDGHVLVVALHEAQGAQLLFFTDFERGFSPWLFRDWLPRELRRSVKPGTAIHALLTKWNALVTEASAASPRERFTRSLALPELQATAWEAAHGFLRAAWP